MKHILHIDINSFFASVEELLNPHYANHPIIVAGRTKRSVVSSANYLARSYGVKAAMPLHLALRLCPNAIIARPHFDVYRNYADKFFNIIAVDFTNRIEVSSIDECYVDITHLIKEHITPYQIAKKIQNTILSKIKLRCSIGIGPNKFLAKMGSDYKKPFGITSIYQEDLPTKI
jgi:DNA polymerase-4